MDVEVRPGTVSGAVTPPPSKSETHRAFFIGALAGGGHIEAPLDAADTRATATAIEALGGTIDWGEADATVSGFPDGRPLAPADPIDCANSGTTLRFAIGIAALTAGSVTLTGDSSLRRRPNAPLLDALSDLGAATESETGDGTAPLSVTGPMHGGETAIDGSISSQFVSSLLLAGGLTTNGVTVELTAPVRSVPYLELTVDALRTCGQTVDVTPARYHIPPGQSLQLPPDGYRIGTDPTAASYPLAAGAIAGDGPVTVTDIGARAGREAPILEVLRSFDITLSFEGRRVTVEATQPTPATIDLEASPDLLPTAAVLAALADGTSHLVNCDHARYKETDRITATADAMRSLGVPVSERTDGLTVRGRPRGLQAGTIDPRGDHRLAMAGAVAALAADGPVRILDAECIEVSYPNFFEDMRTLGANIVKEDGH